MKRYEPKITPQPPRGQKNQENLRTKKREKILGRLKKSGRIAKFASIAGVSGGKFSSGGVGLVAIKQHS